MRITLAPSDATPGARPAELADRLLGAALSLLAALLAAALLRQFASAHVSAWLADKDFANYWAAAKLAAHGRTADVFAPHARYFAQLTRMMGADFPWHAWSYPPSYLLLMMPLALVGYRAGLLLFLLATGLIFVTGLRAYMGRTDRIALAAVAPLVVLDLWTAQNGFLTAGLILWFLALRDKRPIVAGVCLGLVSIKPQLVLLLPLLPLIERRWRLLAAAAATAIGLVLASALAFGIGAWIGFVRDVMPYEVAVMAHFEGVWLTMVPSLFGSGRLAGWDAVTALRLHMLLAAPVLLLTLACLVANRRRRDADVLLPIALFLVMPYTMSYDLGIVGAAIARFIRQEEAAGRRFTIAQQLLLVGAMTLPLSMGAIGRYGIGIAPFVLLGTFILMTSRLRSPVQLR